MESADLTLAHELTSDTKDSEKVRRRNNPFATYFRKVECT